MSYEGMTSSIDSNVLVALWDKDPEQNRAAMAVLDEALTRGKVVVCGSVYAELLGGFGRTKEGLNGFFRETGVEIDWAMDRAVWEIAGLAYHHYVERRSKRKGMMPKRMLTDFLIGGHAMRHGHSLVTQDKRHYRAAFPDLVIFAA